MNTMLDYLAKEETKLRSLVHLHEVDALLLSRVSYLPFERLEGGLKPGETISEACTRLVALPNLKELVYWPDDFDLAHALLDHKRYGDMRMHGFINEIDKDTEMQFSAVAFDCAPGCWVISYRGTDNTLVGWKEDFNMSFTCPVPAQTNAVAYLESLWEALIPEKTSLVLVGHSKGGNLAVYAGAFCSAEIRERVHGVFNFDGPGFPPPILQTPGYRELLPRILTYLPQSSIIGMLMEQEGDYTIVNSKQVSILQHDLYNWEIQNRHLVPLKNFTSSSRIIDSTLKDVLIQLPPDKRAQFVDTFYQLFRETKAEKVGDLSEKPIESGKALLRALNGLDESARGILSQGLDTLYQSAKSSLLDKFSLPDWEFLHFLSNGKNKEDTAEDAGGETTTEAESEEEAGKAADDKKAVEVPESAEENPAR